MERSDTRLMLLQVKTQAGLVRGVPTDVEGLAVFRGIPYASPPVGDNRWRAPQPVEPWEGVRDCTTYGPACVQPERGEGNFYGKEFYSHRFHRYPLAWSEDCLYLNIWTPAQTDTDKLPVFVWIHGGGYTQGYSHEPRSNGEVLASKGMVVVSINYRLNIFGFFGHPELVAEQGGHCGNYAIMDQAAALHWIQDNIAVFGGDPENITVAGQSAGSFSVEALAVTPLAKGTFRRAIMQSGAMGSPWPDGSSWFFVHQKDVEEKGTSFMAFAGKKSLAELRAMPTGELNKAYLAFVADKKEDFNNLCADGYVLTRNPGDMFACGEENIEELLIGATSKESKITPTIPGVNLKNYKQIIDGLPSCDFSLMAQAKVDTDEDASALVNSWFAWYMNGSSLGLCEHMNRVSNKKVYCYSFRREVPGSDRPGPFHSACIWYMFGNLHNARRPFTEEDFTLEETMVGYWSNFAKYGDPNGNGLPEWRAYTVARPDCMVLDVGGGRMEKATAVNPSFALLRDALVKKESDSI